MSAGPTGVLVFTDLPVALAVYWDRSRTFNVWALVDGRPRFEVHVFTAPDPPATANAAAVYAAAQWEQGQRGDSLNATAAHLTH